MKELTIRLSDELLDLDQEITVKLNGVEKFRGKVKRSVEWMWRSLHERPDVKSMATAGVEIK